MEWIALKSRLVSEIAYESEREVLHVRLRTRAQRSYRNISPTMFENLRSAESPGFYYSYYIARPRDRMTSTAPASAMPAQAMWLMRLLAATGVFFASGNLFIH